MRTHHDGHAELRRLQRIVAAGRNQAAADKGHRGQRIDRSQVRRWCRAGRSGPAASGWIAPVGLRFPIRAPDPRDARLLEQRRHCRKALRMARRQHHRQSGIGCEQLRPRFEQRSLFALQRAAGHNKAQPAAIVFSSRVASASCAARTSNFRLPATVTRSGSQPIAISRSASVSALRQHPAESAQESVSRAAAASCSAARSGRRCARSPPPREFCARETAVEQVRPELRLRQDQQAAARRAFR